MNRAWCLILTVLFGLVPAAAVAAEPAGFWSFEPLRYRVPDVSGTGWCRNPVDRFVLAGIQQRGLAPADASSREQLLRRVCLDLLGLPPTAEQRSVFLTDSKPGSWGRLVERLLSNPHFGERWCRHWLDVVRFAESYGFEHDLDNLNAFHFRDFVIRAFNDDLPFDRFVRWQLAGDELKPEDPLARMATGFLAAGVRNADIAKVRVEQERYDELDDLASTVGTAFLGLSIGCARCHDHKYDPISREEYYRFVATFERTIRGEVELSTAPTMHAGLRKVLVAGEGLTPLARVYNPGPAFYEKTWLLRRGDVRLKEREVQSGFLDVLMPVGATPADWRREEIETGKATYRRSRMAAWITDVDRGAGNLLARVIVNRLWQHHFGRGLVTTPSDFGERGERPTHPELLDWLAAELVRCDWQLKSIHRLLVGSATYRQSALAGGETGADSRIFRGRPVRRLEAEAIRDSLLSLGDRFDRRQFGPGTLEERQPRRSVYFRVKRSQPVPLLSLFDGPDTLQGTATRSVTTVSPQALALFNGGAVRAAAESFARVVLPTTRQSAASGVRRVFRDALGREPAVEERDEALAFLAAQQAAYVESQRAVPRGISDRSLVVWLRAEGLAEGPLDRWQNRRPGVAAIQFLPLGPRRPVVRNDATPEHRAAVQFGPRPSVLKTADHPSLNLGTGDFTISVVFQLDRDNKGGYQILGKDSFPGSGGDYTGYFFHETEGKLRFATRNRRGGEGQQNYLDSHGAIVKGRWHRATAVRRQQQLRLFLDDADRVDRELRESAPTNTDIGVGLKLGLIDESLSGAFHGAIAEVRIYRRAMKNDEVRRLHALLGSYYLAARPVDPLELALADLCQAVFCLSEFIYVE